MDLPSPFCGCQCRLSGSWLRYSRKLWKFSRSWLGFWMDLENLQVFSLIVLELCVRFTLFLLVLMFILSHMLPLQKRSPFSFSENERFRPLDLTFRIFSKFPWNCLKSFSLFVWFTWIFFWKCFISWISVSAVWQLATIFPKKLEVFEVLTWFLNGSWKPPSLQFSCSWVVSASLSFCWFWFLYCLICVRFESTSLLVFHKTKDSDVWVWLLEYSRNFRKTVLRVFSCFVWFTLIFFWKCFILWILVSAVWQLATIFSKNWRFLRSRTWFFVGSRKLDIFLQCRLGLWRWAQRRTVNLDEIEVSKTNNCYRWAKVLRNMLLYENFYFLFFSLIFFDYVLFVFF